MITIQIDEEVSENFEMVMLLEEIIGQIKKGNTSGVYPSWSLEGEEEQE